MGKQSGLGDNLYVDQYDLSGDIGSLGGVHGGPAALEVTAINKLAKERIGGQRDGGMEYTSFFNVATGQEHDALSSLPTAARIVSYLRGTTLGKPAACLNSRQTKYDPKRADDAALTIDIDSVGDSYGLEWGHNLTAGRYVSVGTEDLPGFDDGAGAATDFGLQAYLHVFAFTGTSVAITLEDSDDDAATDPYTAITGAAFASVTGVGQQRIQTGRTENVKEWIRVATSGTYSSLDFAVIVVRNEVAVAF